MKRRVLSNPRRVGPKVNSHLPSGTAAIAESHSEHDLLEACALGNRATRRLAARNLRKMRIRGDVNSAGGEGQP